MKRKYFAYISVLMIVLLILSSCGNTENKTGTTSALTTEETGILTTGEAAATTEEKPEEITLEGKVIVNFGDSIYGNKRPPNDISTALADISGATVYNCGFGGARMSTHSMDDFKPYSMYRLVDAIIDRDFSAQKAHVNGSGVPKYFLETVELLESIDFNEVDIITIAYGTNDFTGGMPIDNPEYKYDADSFAGALRYSIKTMHEAFPNLKIVVCGQTYRYWMDSNKKFKIDSDTNTVNGKTLLDFVAKSEEVANKYGAYFIDFYKTLGINKDNISEYFPAGDGTHHNVEGARLIAKHMYAHLLDPVFWEIK